LSFSQAEEQENTCRKDLAPSEMVAKADRLEPLEREAAKERQGTRTDLEHSAKLAGSSREQSRDKVAFSVGVGRTTLKKARDVVKAEKEDPEVFGVLVEEMDNRERDWPTSGRDGAAG